MHIIAIDPGYDKCGYSVFIKEDDPCYVTSGLIKTKSSMPIHKRLQVVYQQLEIVVKEHKPKSIAVEKLFFSKNAKTAMGVSQSIGAILLLAANHNLELIELTPNQIKEVICGYGNADKRAVQKMLWLQLNEVVKIKDDDESDAIACGLAACLRNTNLY
ncbi:MAG: crossover junction endodeoxyribonuclease RuvC [Patescibacteria group bacterium]